MGLGNLAFAVIGALLALGMFFLGVMFERERRRHRDWLDAHDKSVAVSKIEQRNAELIAECERGTAQMEMLRSQMRERDLQKGSAR